MRAGESLLHPMLLHSPKRNAARSIRTGKAIDDLQVIGQIERPTVKLYVAVGAETKNVPVHIRTTVGATQSLNVGTFRVTFTVGTDLQGDAADLAGKSVQVLHPTSHSRVADDAINRRLLPANLGVGVTISSHLSTVNNILDLLLKRGEVLSIIRKAKHLEAADAKSGSAYFIPFADDLI